MMTRLVHVVWLCALTFLSAASARAELRAGEGFIDVPGGQAWYRVYAGKGSGTPLLVVHGGPGGRSCVFSSLSVLTDDRPVVLYDQLGGGRSEQPDNPSLWTVERTVQELEAVRATLGIERVHLLGHSWGAALIAEYVIARRPEGIASMIFSSPYLSTPHWMADMERLKAELPDYVRRVIERHESAGTTDSDEYQTATAFFYMRHLFHRFPVPHVAECEGSVFGEQVYNTMWGPSEFRVTGSLKTFDRSRDLKQIAAPVLYLTGQYDEATPETVAEFQRLTPGSQFVILADSAHMSMLEQPELFAAAIRAFLRHADSP